MSQASFKYFTNGVHIDGETWDQFFKVLENPHVKHGVLLPDAHVGYSMPIGTVAMADQHIMPAYVGYDIGCGMLVAKLRGVTEDMVRSASYDIFHEIYNSSGVMSRVRSNALISTQEYDARFSVLNTDAAERINKRGGRFQIGTLGSGNHFIEIGVFDGEVYVTIHSGSRGYGHAIGSAYMAIDSETSGLDISSIQGQNYIFDMNRAIDFASSNRLGILSQVQIGIGIVLGKSISTEEVAHCLHNFAELADDGMIIHRKGATSVRYNEIVAIPGDMKAGVCLAEGTKDVDKSMFSCSHGAGRLKSRKKAKADLSLEEFAENMNGIVAKVDEGTLSEAPGAYKDVFDVMDAQKEIVRVVGIIEPIINIKG